MAKLTLIKAYPWRLDKLDEFNFPKKSEMGLVATRDSASLLGVKAVEKNCQYHEGSDVPANVLIIRNPPKEKLSRLKRLGFYEADLSMIHGDEQ